MTKYIFTLSVLFVFSYALAFSAQGNLSGSVFSANNGKAVKEYEIDIEGTYRRLHVADLDGRFGFAKLDAGEYVVSIAAEGYEKFVAFVNIPANKEVRYRFFISIVDSKIKASFDYLGEFTLSGFSIGLAPDILRAIPQDPGQPAQSISMIKPDLFLGEGTIKPLRINFACTDFSNPFSGRISEQSPTPSLLGLSQVSVPFLYSQPESKNEPVSIDIEPNRGKENGYDMFFRVGFGLPSLNGSMHNDLSIESYGSNNEVHTTDGGPKLLGRGEFAFEYGISGPLPGANKGSTFALSIRNYSQDHNYGLDVYDIVGNNYGKKPNQSTLIRNVNSQFKIVLDHRTKIYAEGMFAATTKENSSDQWLYATDKQTVQTGKTVAIERQMKQNAENVQYDRLAAAIEFDLPSAMTLKIGLARNGFEYKYGRRSNGDDASWTTGFDMYEPADKYSHIYSNNRKGDSLVRGSNLVIDNYEMLFQNGFSEDHYQVGSYPVANPLTGFSEFGYLESTSNPYGFINELLDTDFDSRSWTNNTSSQDGILYQKMENYSADVSFSKYFEAFGTKNDFSSKLDFSYSILKKIYIDSPWSVSPRYDIYTDEAFVNYVGAKNSLANENRTPILSNLSISNRLVYRGLTIQPTLKATFMDPGHRDSINLFFKSIKNQTSFSISPSLFVAYQATDGTNISATAAIYNTILPYDYYLSGQQNDVIGNPNLGFRKTKHISLTVDQRVLPDLFIRASAFQLWTDFPDETFYSTVLNTVYFVYDWLPNHQYIEHGINFQTIYKMNNNLSFNFNFSSLADNDFFSSSKETRTSFSALVTYSLGRFEGFSINEFFPLAGTSISLAATSYPGYYYFLINSKGQIVKDELQKTPTTYSIDMRVSKMFYFADIFPSLSGGSGIEVAFDVLNLFDFTKPFRYNPITDDPDATINLRNTPASLVGTGTYYKSAYFGNPNTFSADQYDSKGRRLYNAAADYDNDGKVTTEERYTAYFSYYETVLRQRSNYQLPRRVFMSVTLKF